GRSLAHVVGLRLERQAPHRYALAFQRSEVLLHPPEQPHLLALVDVLDRLMDLDVVVLGGGELYHRLHVFWETTAAVTDAGKQEGRADAAIRRDRAAHLIDV